MSLAPLLVHEVAGRRVVRLWGEGLPKGLGVPMAPELASHGVALPFQWLARSPGHRDVCVLDPLREGSALLSAPLLCAWDERLETWEQPTDGASPLLHRRGRL